MIARTERMVASIVSSTRVARPFSSGWRSAVRWCSIDTSSLSAIRFCPSSSWISSAMRLRSSSLIDSWCADSWRSWDSESASASSVRLRCVMSTAMQIIISGLPSASNTGLR